MAHDPIPLTLDDLRTVSCWAAECAERALPLVSEEDDRPRAAVAAIRAFAGGGARTQALRTAAWAALAAAREVDGPAASAARAAGLAAAVAYTHPIASAHQINHLLGPAACAAWAVERSGGDGDAEIARAVASASEAVREVVRRFPESSGGRERLGELQKRLETALRGNA